MASHNIPQRQREEKKVSSVVSSPVKVKKKSAVSRVAGSIFSGDRDGIGEEIIQELIIPSIKDLIFDSLSRMLEALFYRKGERKVKSKVRGGYVSYDSYSRKEEPRRSYSSAVQADEMIYGSYEEAHAVLDVISELMGQYHMVSVAELKDASGITPDDYTDEYYGWVDISDAYISKIRDGYLLHMPRVVQLPLP